MREVRILDVVSVWAKSIEQLMADLGVEMKFRRTDDDRDKHSCWMNLRKGACEAELTLWDSGEAELYMKGRNGEIIDRHLDEVDADKLGPLLAGLIAAVYGGKASAT